MYTRAWLPRGTRSKRAVKCSFSYKLSFQPWKFVSWTPVDRAQIDKVNRRCCLACAAMFLLASFSSIRYSLLAIDSSLAVTWYASPGFDTYVHSTMRRPGGFKRVTVSGIRFNFRILRQKSGYTIPSGWQLLAISLNGQKVLARLGRYVKESLRCEESEETSFYTGDICRDGLKQ
jgi:hypothetical protein